MQKKSAGLGTIETTLSLLPFDGQDAVIMIDWANQIRQQGIRIFLSRDAATERDLASWMNAGLIVLRSQTLDVEILLIKAKATESVQIEGGVYRTFVGDYANDRWGEGATFRSLETALMVITELCASAPAYGRGRPSARSSG